MKVIKIIVAAAFVIITIATAVVFTGEKIKTDRTLPLIKIDGETMEVNLDATDKDLLKGVTAYDEKDGDLTDKIIVESISRFTEKGVCKVSYAVCDNDNNVAKATRKIKYKGYESPKFKVKENLCFSLYERIDISDIISASDCLEGSITSGIIITSSSYSATEAGAYSINVTVTNKKGDNSTIQLPLIVEDRPISAPKIELKEYLVYTDKGKAVDFNSYIVDALDSNENSLKDKILVESDADFNKEGTYHVHYYVTDENDVRGHSVLTVIVGD